MSCPDCERLAEMNDKLMQRAVAAEEAKTAQVEIANGLQHKVNGLKAALTASFKEGEFSEELASVHSLWQDVCDHPRAELGPKRANAVKARLNGQKTLADLRWAVMGAGQFRYKVNGRRSRTGAREERWDDLELICRDETKVEELMGCADDHAAWVYDRAVHTLVHAFGAVLTPVDEEQSGWYAPCPCHDVSLADLRVRPGTAEVGRWLDLRCVRGCEPDQILERLRGLAEAQQVVSIQGRAA